MKSSPCTALLALLVLASPAIAQRGTTVTGTVYDSLGKAPLAGAVVQIVQVDSVAGRNYTATADAMGRYRLESLPRGRFGIGFQHTALDALGLDSPLRAFQVGTDTTLVIDLAIPSGPQVRAERCPGGNAADGMLAGLVLDARRGSTVPGATVTLGWTEVGVADKKLQTIPKRLEVKVEEDGTYIACGLASETPLTLQVMSGAHRALLGEITVPEGSALRRDFRLADTAVVAGASAVVGRMVHADSQPVSSGTASIAALELDAPVTNGAFVIANVPPGTWLVESRVIGYEPQAALVDVGEGAPAALSITVGRKAQLLDAVTVVGKMSRDIGVLSDLVKRSRAGGGTTFLPGNVWLESALYPADVLRAARGFQYLSYDSVRARGCAGATAVGPRKIIAIYLDGFRMAEGFSDIQTMVNMRDVLAVEAYPDMLSVPAQFKTLDACAVIAIWTKR